MGKLQFAFMAVVGLTLLAAAGCGRKAAPLPPEIRVADPTRDLQVVLEAAMEKELPHRYQTAADLAEDLHRFRVFEPIVSFQAEAHARSLSWIIYNDLIAAGNPL